MDVDPVVLVKHIQRSSIDSGALAIGLEVQLAYTSNFGTMKRVGLGLVSLGT